MTVHFAGIILFVNDVEKLKAFYTGIFQFSLAEEIEKEWVLLKAGDTELGLHRTGAAWLPAEGESFRAESNAKLVFETDELTSIHKKLVEEKLHPGKVQSWDNYPYLLFDCEDPEGNVFQVKQKK